MSVTHGYRYVCCEMNVFFDVFINHFQKTHRSFLHKRTIDLLYFWDAYDINLWEKLAITVKLCLIETRLKKGYNLQDYFLKITRETINVLTIVVIHYFSEWASFRSSCLEVLSKKVFFKFRKIYSKKPVPAACNFI